MDTTPQSRHTMSDHSDGGEERSRKRARVRQACLPCRRKKTACGGEKPVCSFCSRLSQTCIYTQDGRSQKRDSFASHTVNDEMSNIVMGAVTARLEALENGIATMQDTLERFETLLSSLAQAQPSAMAAYHSPPSVPVIQTSAGGHVGSLGQLPSGSTLSQARTRFLHPPIHTLLFAADVYFRFCHNQPYSLFHEATFRDRLASGELPEHQLWALLAMARRYSTLPDLQLNAADDAMFYAKRAWDCLELPWACSVQDQEVVQIIQTIVLIVAIEHPAGHCASAYMKLGFAVRMALHSKMQFEPDSSLPPMVREERRRAFWALYLQDKLISLTKERFPILRDEECSVHLPSSEAAFRDGVDEIVPTLKAFTGDCLDATATDPCSPLALISVMASVLSRVSQYVLQQNNYAQLGLPWSSTSPYAAIASTLLQLDMHFGMSDPPGVSLEKRCFVEGAVDQHLAGSFIYAKALFHLSHCLLHHPFLLQQRLQSLGQKSPSSFMRTAWKTCRAHAMSLTDLKDMRNHNVITLTSIYGYCTMIAGTIHVLAMSDEKEAVREEGRNHYRAAMDFLRELSCYWKHAELMTNRLERFSKQNKDRPQRLNPCKRDAEALWQSVDYALLSTPTRDASPVPEDMTPGLSDFDFDFADLGMLGDSSGTCEAFSLGLPVGPPDLQ